MKDTMLKYKKNFLHLINFKLVSQILDHLWIFKFDEHLQVELDNFLISNDYLRNLRPSLHLGAWIYLGQAPEVHPVVEYLERYPT